MTCSRKSWRWLAVRCVCVLSKTLPEVLTFESHIIDVQAVGFAGPPVLCGGLGPKGQVSLFLWGGPARASDPVCLSCFVE